MREKIKKVVVDENSNLVFYVKNHNVIPQYMAFISIGSKFKKKGEIYVPNHILLNNVSEQFLLIEGVIWNHSEAIKWYELKCDENKIKNLAYSMVQLVAHISESSKNIRELSFQDEFVDIFNVYPTGVCTSRYKEVFNKLKPNIGNRANKEQFLLPRDFYNNILIGVPWSENNTVKIKIPLSIIDFGEVYKYTTVSELIAEILSVYLYENRGQDVSAFINEFVRLLKERKLWIEEELTFFYVLWNIKLLMWKDVTSEEQITDVYCEASNLLIGKSNLSDVLKLKY